MAPPVCNRSTSIQAKHESFLRARASRPRPFRPHRSPGRAASNIAPSWPNFAETLEKATADTIEAGFMTKDGKLSI
jgi:hypothetical protein